MAVITDLPAEMLHAIGAHLPSTDVHSLACTNRGIAHKIWGERIRQADAMLARCRAIHQKITAWAHADFAKPRNPYYGAFKSKKIAVASHVDLYVGIMRAMYDVDECKGALDKALWHAYVDKRWRIAFRFLQLTVTAMSKYHVEKAALCDAPPEVFKWMFQRTPVEWRTNWFGTALVYTAAKQHTVALTAVLNLPGMTTNYYFIYEAVREAAAWGHRKAVKLLWRNSSAEPGCLAMMAFLSAYANGHMQIVDDMWPHAREYQATSNTLDDNHTFTIFKNQSATVGRRGKRYPYSDMPSYDCACQQYGNCSNYDPATEDDEDEDDFYDEQDEDDDEQDEDENDHSEHDE